MRIRGFLIPLLPWMGILVLLLFISLESGATGGVVADPIEVHARREVERRQALDNSSSISTSSSTPPPPTTSSSIITTPPPTTSSSTPPPPPTTSSSETPTSSEPSSTPQTIPSTTKSTSSTRPTSLTTSWSPSYSTYTTDVVTVVNGVSTTMAEVVTSSTLVPTTFVVGLQNDFTSTGLSDHSKNIVIGVVVGIGGAAILALIAVIVWRHLRKEDEEKRNTANLTYFSDEANEFGSGPGAASPGSNKEGEFRSPNVNAASNF